ncbi:MAG TPA: excisionase family DNA-binding protein [Herpetosiphonaceae bacterium]|nr:excisionase family DNA-binding protein [Herpetosiphonaceae bacterium]
MPRVTIREAAQRLGVSTDTIRRQIRRGELTATRVHRGQGSVLYVEIPDTVPNTTPTAEPYATPGAESLSNSKESPVPGVANSNATETEILRDYVAELKRQLEVREREVAQLHTLLAQAHHALPQPRAEQTAAPYAAHTQPSAASHPERSEGSSSLWQRFVQCIGL